MKTEFVKWGNSLALRVPAAFAREVGAREGKQADMTVENGALIVKVAKPRKPKGHRRYQLEKLVERITKENRHSEADWGRPLGNEIW